MSDEDDQVRQSVCLSLPSLCRRIGSSDYRRSFAVKAVKALTEGDDDVRCAALEMLGEAIHIFEKDSGGPPIELLEIYLDDRIGHNSRGESDWDVIAMFNVCFYDHLKDF